MSEVLSKAQKDNVSDYSPSITSNPITNDLSILSYYTGTSKYNRAEIFDKFYNQGLELMAGDKLLKPASSISSVIIRKTTTPGLYKLILNNSKTSGAEIKYIDEGQLINNKEYCSGTISKLDKDSYEITYFDDEDEIVIEHFSKMEAIDFLDKQRLIIQT